VDAKGRFWAGEIDLPAMAGRVPANHEPTGRLFRFDPDGTLAQHESGILCSNGIGWSPDNTKMYYNDSLGRVMHQYDFDLERGTLSNRIIFVDQRTIGGEPDGLVVDTRGNVWTAMFGRGCVECYNPEGTLVQRITVATRNTTCPGWARADLSTMFITSAENEGREEFRQEKQEFGGDLFYVKLDIAGLPKFRFGQVKVDHPEYLQSNFHDFWVSCPTAILNNRLVRFLNDVFGRYDGVFAKIVGVCGVLPRHSVKNSKPDEHKNKLCVDLVFPRCECRIYTKENSHTK